MMNKELQGKMRIIPIKEIQIDLEHPSLASVEATNRHIECVQLLEESLKKLPTFGMTPVFVKPIVVCEREDGGYWLIDGWGRVAVTADFLGESEIGAMILPPQSLESRLKLRLMLNA